MRPRRATVAAVGLAVAILIELPACGSDNTESTTTDIAVSTRLDFHSPRTLLDLIEYEAAAFDDIAQCMREQGFEYKPFLYTRERERLPTLIADGLADPVAFARTHGYGVTDPDWDTSPDFDPANFSPPDPAYDRALYGDVDLSVARPEGCWGDRVRPIVDATAQFEESRRDLNARIDQDERVEAARQLWERCMAEQGFAFGSPSEALDHFQQESQRIRFSAVPGAPVDPGDLDDLLTEEIRTAVADQVDCDGIELRALRNEVAQEIGLPEEARDALELMTADDG